MVKEYRKRKYKDGSTVIYTKASGNICECKDEKNAQLVLDALNNIPKMIDCYKCGTKQENTQRFCVKCATCLT